MKYVWNKMLDEIPKHDTAIIVKMKDGTLHEVCRFDDIFESLKEFLSKEATEDDLRKALEKEGEKYGCFSWVGNESTKIDVKKIEEWKYIKGSPLNEFLEDE